jgi:hypothetical protein
VAADAAAKNREAIADTPCLRHSRSLGARQLALEWPRVGLENRTLAVPPLRRHWPVVSGRLGLDAV